jgi:hypothetical protein
MTKVPINDAKHWRERAEEARTVADQMNDADSKRKMLRIAQDYEELARVETAVEAAATAAARAAAKIPTGTPKYSRRR